MAGVRPSGHLQVKGEAGKRGYYALWRDADGRHQRLLGPAHVKDSRRRTPRGAVIWRVGDGPKALTQCVTCAWALVVGKGPRKRGRTRSCPAGSSGQERQLPDADPVRLDHGNAAGLELGGECLEVAEKQGDLFNGPTLGATAKQDNRRRG